MNLLKKALAECCCVAEVVKKLPCGKLPDVDEIHPEMLKDLDIVGLLWQTRLFSVT